jgi:hypothetical protein
MSVLKTLAGQAAQLDRGYAWSFLTQLTAAVKKIKPSGVDVCWEGGHSRRAAVLPGYKSNRVGSSEQLRDERGELQQLLCSLGADQYVAPGHEADDMIASLVNTVPGEHVIMSADKDMLQLVSSRVSVYQKVRTTGTKSQRMLITAANFQECTGWPDPNTWLKAHCALGDAVDCVPKVAGVGPGMIHAYWLGMEVPPSKRKILDAFYAGSAQYKLNMQLIELITVRQLPHERVPGRLVPGDVYRQLEAMQFNSLTAKFGDWLRPWEQVAAHADLSAVSPV